jgi:hypothetical protein
MTGQLGLWFRLQRKSQGSLTCRKSATWDRRLYFPSEERHAVDFFARKIRRLRPGSNPRSWIPEASMLTTRPPKPLLKGGSLLLIALFNYNYLLYPNTRTSTCFDPLRPFSGELIWDVAKLRIKFICSHLGQHYIKVQGYSGARSGSVVEALRYKPEGRGIDFRWYHWNFPLT